MTDVCFLVAKDWLRETRLINEAFEPVKSTTTGE